MLPDVVGVGFEGRELFGDVDRVHAGDGLANAVRDLPKERFEAGFDVGITPDGNLLWMTAATMVPSMCTSYRTLLVLAKEPAGWRIVHQHYSEALYLDD